MRKISIQNLNESLDPCLDSVFKAIFTNESFEAEEALKSLISSCIDRIVEFVAYVKTISYSMLVFSSAFFPGRLNVPSLIIVALHIYCDIFIKLSLKFV